MFNFFTGINGTGINGTSRASNRDVTQQHLIAVSQDDSILSKFFAGDDVVEQRAELELRQLQDNEQMKALQKTSIKVEQDSYSLLMLIIVLWWDGNRSARFWVTNGDYGGRFQRLPCVAIIYAVVLYLMGAGFQLVITLMLFRNSFQLLRPWYKFDGGEVNIIQASEHLAMAVSSTNDTYLVDNRLKWLEEKCKETNQVEMQMCYPIMLFMWVAKMIPEFRNAGYLFRDLFYVDPAVKGQPLLASDGVTILRLDPILRTILLLLVPVMRLVVAAVVLEAGLWFLVSMNATGSIIIKAFCMQFVTDIDNLFLTAFASDSARNLVSRARLFVCPKGVPFGKNNPERWEMGAKGLVWIAGAMILVAIVTGGCGLFAHFCPQTPFITPRLMYFRWQCQFYCDAFPDRCEND